MVMRILNEHQSIIQWWHDTTDLLARLGLINARGATPAHATHNFSVEWAQQSLNHLTGSNLQIDGRMGPQTVAATKAYQQQRGLDPDGWLGVLTLAQLEKDMARP